MAIIDKPSDYFETVLYTGNGSTQSITSLDFQPDWVWLKQRNTTRSHWLFDSVRTATERLHSDSSDAEATDTSTLTSFNSNGFSLGSSVAINQSSGTYASWNWKAGGTAASNTNGSITSSVSANQTAGFSIVSYTGTGSAATVGHGLGSELACYIIKQRNTTGGWIVYHKGNTSSPQTDYLRLDKTDATVDDAIFNDTAPTSSVFSIGTNAPVNTSSGTYIAYCFSEVKGFSKFGGFVANGTTDNSFIYTGMKPAFVMFKRSDGTGNWGMWDNKRNTFNVMNKYLLANTNGAEGTDAQFDLLSNGIKIRTSGFASGNWIYMAFAENPFVTSTGVPTTAR